jgi:hypothetical protein
MDIKKTLLLSVLVAALSAHAQSLKELHVLGYHYQNSQGDTITNCSATGTAQGMGPVVTGSAQETCREHTQKDTWLVIDAETADTKYVLGCTGMRCDSLTSGATYDAELCKPGSRTLGVLAAITNSPALPKPSSGPTMCVHAGFQGKKNKPVIRTYEILSEKAKDAVK